MEQKWFLSSYTCVFTKYLQKKYMICRFHVRCSSHSFPIFMNFSIYQKTYFLFICRGFFLSKQFLMTEKLGIRNSWKFMISSNNNIYNWQKKSWKCRLEKKSEIISTRCETFTMSDWAQFTPRFWRQDVSKKSCNF